MPREQCSVEFWCSKLFLAAVGQLQCPPSSPTMVLLERLQLVGLIQPWIIGHGELCARLGWAWNKYVAAQVSHQVDFCWILLDLLVLTLPRLERHSKLLGLSGGLFTRNADSHWNGDSDQCKWCQQKDSLEHRYLSVPVSLLCELSMSLMLSGSEATCLRHWRYAVGLSSPNAPAVVSPVGFPSFIFTWPPLWMVPVSGKVPHPSALNFLPLALSYSECLGVVKKIRLLTQGSGRLKTTSSSADLWKWILESVQLLGLDNIRVHKTAEHKHVCEARSFGNFGTMARLTKWPGRPLTGHNGSGISGRSMLAACSACGHRLEVRQRYCGCFLGRGGRTTTQNEQGIHNTF